MATVSPNQFHGSRMRLCKTRRSVHSLKVSCVFANASDFDGVSLLFLERRQMVAA